MALAVDTVYQINSNKQKSATVIQRKMTTAHTRRTSSQTSFPMSPCVCQASVGCFLVGLALR
uniref:Uncharacterized protein n=2 Tax=Anguilla anguilla TaxID=7936 RepID=A0A0E9U377_ANGAN